MYTKPIAPPAFPRSIQRALDSLEVTSNLSPRFGGIPNSLVHLTDALTRTTSCGSQIAAFGGSADYSPEWPKANVIDLPASRIRWAFDRSLRERLESLISQSQLCHIHGIWQAHSQFVGPTARRLRKPYIVSAHGMLETWALSQKKLKKRLYSALSERSNLEQATFLRALTPAEAADYRRLGLKNKIAIIPNGVAIPHSISSSTFFERFTELKGKTIVLFMGRIHPKKGIDILCRAWSQIAPSHRNAQLVIAGPDFEGTQAKLEDLLASTGCPESVTFTGILTGTQKWAALAAANAFVLCSHSEGFSMAILEALAAGIPVIATHQCNFPDISASQCGWLIQPDDKSVERSLRELLESTSNQLASMANRGKQLIQSRFTWHVVANQMAELYRSVADREPPTTLDTR